MGRLDGKVVVITGSNSGVGAACAKMCAQEGAKVVISARRVEALKTVEEEIKSLELALENYNKVSERIAKLENELNN